MQLKEQVADIRQVQYVVNRIRRQSKILAADVICAYNLFCDNHPEMNRDDLKCLERAFVLCRYMAPEAEDVIMMLLYCDYMRGKVTKSLFSLHFGEKRSDRYYNQIKDVCESAPRNDAWTLEDCIGYEIMVRVCNRMFTRLSGTINKNKAPIIMVSDAYNMAREAHRWKKRKSGEPYLAHAIRVAIILGDIGVESPIIAAAMLHDIVEETNITLADISGKCGVRVSQYVDAVTSVKKEYAASLQPSEYGCDKTELDERSLEKLINTVKEDKSMIFALYIKAADQIDNLRTMDRRSDIEICLQDAQSQPYDEILSYDETQPDYTPLFKAFHLEYFVREIEDLMWRATDIDRYTKMQEKYEDLTDRNQEFIDEFKSVLSAHTQKEVNLFMHLSGYAGYTVDIYERLLLPYEVYHQIKGAGGTIGDLSKRIDKRFVPVCDIDVVVEPKDTNPNMDMFVAGFAKMFEKKIAVTGRTITNFYKESDKVFVFEVEDRYRNVFRCRIVLRKDHDEWIKGIYVSNVSQDLAEDYGGKTEQVNIKLRNGKWISMPKGSTVIDVAFEIHEQIGLTARSAIVNNKRRSIYYVLQEGDQVVVEADSAAPNMIRHVRISWLKWVVTKKAKKKIIDFLSDLYEGDDPRNESKAQNEVVERVADRIWGTMQNNG